jgi:chromosome segregation ATPase
MGEIYSLTDLMNRYNISRQAIQQYLTSHMEEINSDGIHAKKVKGDWQLDAIGLQKLDTMRGYNSNLALQAELRQENEKYKLLEEISTLKTAMLTIKEKYQQNKEELYKRLLLEKDRAHKAELLQLESKSHLERQKEVAEAEKAALLAKLEDEKDQREALNKEKTETAQKIAKMEQESKKQAEEIYRLRTQLNTERQKTWWDKLFNK